MSDEKPDDLDLTNLLDAEAILSRIDQIDAKVTALMLLLAAKEAGYTPIEPMPVGLPTLDPKNATDFKAICLQTSDTLPPKSHVASGTQDIAMFFDDLVDADGLASHQHVVRHLYQAVFDRIGVHDRPNTSHLF